MLISLGQVVAGALRETDTLARYGGEEFLVITPHTPLRAAIDVAEKICKRIQSHGFSLSNGPRGIREIAVTVSVGVASLDDQVDSKDKLVQTADENLYRAKREGRNRVVAGTPTAPGPATPIAVPQSRKVCAARIWPRPGCAGAYSSRFMDCLVYG